MTRTHPDIDESEVEARRARQETVFTLFVLLAAVVVTVLAGRGQFRSAMLFPQVFAAMVPLLLLLSLLKARPVGWSYRMPLALIAVAIALAAPIVHLRAHRAFVESTERLGMQQLAGQPAPPIRYSAALGLDSQAPPTESGAIWFERADRDRVTLVNFWATWCGPCRKEMPLLEAAWQESGSEGLEIIGVTRRYETLEELEQFLRGRGISYPVVVEGPHDVHGDYRVVSLPSSVLIDQQGRVVDYGVGIDGTERLLETARALLAGDSG